MHATVTESADSRKRNILTSAQLPPATTPALLVTAVVAVDFARVVKHKPGEQHPHLLRWRASMAQRPSMSL